MNENLMNRFYAFFIYQNVYKVYIFRVKWISYDLCMFNNELMHLIKCTKFKVFTSEN